MARKSLGSMPQTPSRIICLLYYNSCSSSKFFSTDINIVTILKFDTHKMHIRSGGVLREPLEVTCYPTLGGRRRAEEEASMSSKGTAVERFTLQGPFVERVRRRLPASADRECHRLPLRCPRCARGTGDGGRLRWMGCFGILGRITRCHGRLSRSFHTFQKRGRQGPSEIPCEVA